MLQIWSFFCRYASICLAAISIFACSWFPESSFFLAPDSRLPAWISLHGVNSNEVTVGIDFIIPLTGAYARVTVTDRTGSVIERMDATLVSKVGVQTADGTAARGEYPNYDVAVANGVVDIFEQRKPTNTLYMCDDPVVWSKLAPGAVMPRRGVQ